MVSPVSCVQVGIWTPEKNENSKFTLGTLNLCLKLPKKMQKIIDESDHTRLRKLKSLNLTDIWQFSDVFLIGDDQIDI